jgi:branched-chain amino acid transport system substrate-binding protein
VNRRTGYLLLLALVLSPGGEAQNKLQSPPEPAEQDLPIAIGLLLPDRSCSDIIQAAELAIDHANASGGYMNREFSLVVRTAEGFWGAGSKESVSLVYDDQVCAIIGSLDGRNGHLAEQVATKSHLTYIETYATEPTLSQAFVPWFMRVVPNDNQQALSILHQINRDGGGKIAILTRDNYDTGYAVRSLTKAMALEYGVPPLVIRMDGKPVQQEQVIEKILNSGIANLVIPFDAPYMEELIPSLKKADPELKIYGTLHFIMDAQERNAAWDHFEGVYLVTPVPGDGSAGLSPRSRPAYVTDAMGLVINAIRHAGTERQAITDYIAGSEYRGAATGPVAFDDMGNRLGDPALCRIENGIPSLLH